MSEPLPLPISDSLANLAVVRKALNRGASAGKAREAGARDVAAEQPVRGQANAEPVEPDVTDLAAQRQQAWDLVVPRKFRGATIEDFAGQPEVADELAAWTAAPAGRNLVLLGPTGTGKSHAAAAAVRSQFFDSGASLRYLGLTELLDLLRPGGDGGAWLQLTHVGLLVVDDLGAERETDWTAERLYTLVNRRWLDELPIVATTNLPGDQLESALGPRTFSRLVGDGAVVLRMTGEDRRRG